MLPGFGRCAGFSTSFWRIHGWLPRQALRRRVVGMASFMRRLSPAAPPAAPEPRGAALRDDYLVGVASAASFCGCWLLSAARRSGGSHELSPRLGPESLDPRMRGDDGC